MSLKTRLGECWRSGVAGAILCALVGLLLAVSRLGTGLAHWSYDLGFLIRPPATWQDDTGKAPLDQGLVVLLDERTFARMTNMTPKHLDRREFARAVQRFTEDGARVVVFDIWFKDPGDPEANRAFIEAMQENGHVVLAAYRDVSRVHEVSIGAAMPPPDFESSAAAWGFSNLRQEQGQIVRQFHPGTSQGPNLPFAAARVAGFNVPDFTPADMARHWIRYYGPSGTAIPQCSFADVFDQPRGFFRDKCIFIGGGSALPYLDEPVDVHPTPFSRWGGALFPGVEIVATVFFNLFRGDWLEHPSRWQEAALVIVCGLFFGFLLGVLRPGPAALIAVVLALTIMSASLLAVWQSQVWWPWLWVVAVQLPAGFLWSVIAQTRRLYRQKEVLEKVIESSLTSGALRPEALSALASDSPTATQAPTQVNHAPEPPKSALQVPDHTLLRCVGRGAYGEVWLARNAIGLYRAVKIVRRNEFSRAGPYEREFNGIRKFMPISLQHPGLLHLLHVGRNDAEGYFYCIMEVADDAQSGQKIDPERYTPRTLATILKHEGPIPPNRLVPWLIELTDALQFLHDQGLIHRDIKPTNIIFVEGVAKLADIGLVTEAATDGRQVTLLGTAGYLAPEGPGTPEADLYSLGKVIYEATFARDPDLFPELPTGLEAQPHHTQLMELNRIIGKACQTDPARRYRSAQAMKEDLLRVLQG